MHYRKEFVPHITDENIAEMRETVPRIDTHRNLSLSAVETAKNFVVDKVNREIPVHYCVTHVELLEETKEGFYFKVRVFD